MPACVQQVDTWQHCMCRLAFPFLMSVLQPGSGCCRQGWMGPELAPANSLLSESRLQQRKNTRSHSLISAFVSRAQRLCKHRPGRSLGTKLLESYHAMPVGCSVIGSVSSAMTSCSLATAGACHMGPNPDADVGGREDLGAEGGQGLALQACGAFELLPVL